MHVVLVGPEREENLSLRYLAAALRQAGHTASLARFDSPEHLPGVVEQARRERPGLVGLSLVFQLRVGEYSDLVRALRGDGYAGHITAGGHFATFAYDTLLADLPELDSIGRQEGEQTIVELAEALQRGAGADEVAAIPGMVTRGPEGLVLAPLRRQVDDLDSLPFPARDTPPELHLGIPTAYMVGSRGCYAACDYCCISAWHKAASGKRFRLRSVGNIAEEMAQLYHERGVRNFVFHDDNFFLPTAAASRERFVALRDEVQRRTLDDIGLVLKLRANDADRESLLILKDIGLMRAFVGIENASQRQLKSLGRAVSVEQLDRCLDMLRELDIYCAFNMLLFDAHTTLDDIATNLRFLWRHTFHPFNWCRVEVYAGTALERRYEQEGRLLGRRPKLGYNMDDPRAQLMFELLLPAIYDRNFDCYGLSNLNIGLGYHHQLLRHFHREHWSPELAARMQGLMQTVNADALELLGRASDFAGEVGLTDRAAIERFGEELKRDALAAQQRLTRQVEGGLAEIEARAAMRPLQPAGSAGSLPRRAFLRLAWTGLLGLLAGCDGKKKPPPPIVPDPLPPPTTPSRPPSPVDPPAAPLDRGQQKDRNGK